MHSNVAALIRLSTQLLAVAAVLLLMLAAGPVRAQAAPLGLVSLLDGDAVLLRDSSKYALAEGVALRRDDIIETGAKTQFTLLEFSDGSSLALGPSSSVQIAPHLAAERGKLEPRIYLRQGWVKVSAAKGTPWAINSSLFDLTGLTQEAVLALLGNTGQIFAEAGELSVQPLPPLGSGPPQRLGSGEFLAWSGTGKPEFARRPPASFAQNMPRAFQDKLPSRAALFQGKDIKPNRLAEIAYADAQPWLDAEAALRKANLQRWKPLARLPEFRKGLLAGMKAHPEWESILLAAQAAPAAASAVKY
jgi:hypothetical protein